MMNIDNITTVLTAIAGLLLALWRFSESPLGKALATSKPWSTGSRKTPGTARSPRKS